VVCDVSVDGCLQIDDADEGTAFEASFGQRSEEAFNWTCSAKVESH
jgi:hypothetical protein